MSGFIALALILAVAAALAVAWPLLRQRAVDQGRRSILGPVLLLLLPVAAGALYLESSDWDWNAPDTPAVDSAPPSIEVLIAQLEQRLVESPEDLEGWKLLGRTRGVTGDFAAAGEAFARALQLSGGTDPEAMVGYGEALVRQDAAQFEAEAGGLFERALEQLPEDPRALWYGGVTAWRKQDFDSARTRWQKLRTQGGEPEVMAFLDERIAEIDAMLGPAASSEADQHGIRVKVNLAPGLENRVPEGAALFVVARKGDRGPPLAAQRRLAAELPLEVVITDRDAMLPGTSLKGAGLLRILARISATGQPVASPGDLFGEVAYDPASGAGVSVVIDQVVN